MALKEGNSEHDMLAFNCIYYLWAGGQISSFIRKRGQITGSEIADSNCKILFQVRFDSKLDYLPAILKKESKKGSGCSVVFRSIFTTFVTGEWRFSFLTERVLLPFCCLATAVRSLDIT